ncbi:MAG: putative DNA binding domain-containing protein [Desulfobacterales bacterium]|nr:putative DNA binding domain-containing protein [Desulfobacterales bacterium]
MKTSALMNLVALGEGFTTEFKRAGTSNLGREICAFANATGGTILIGVTDSGDIVGVGDHNRLKSEVQATARSAEPPIAVDVESAGGVLLVTVPVQHGKPYSFGGKFFMRKGASSQQMSREEIRDFFFKEGLIHFDEMPCSRFSMEEDLTDNGWNLFRKRAKIPVDMDARTALENLHLAKNGQMTHAGAWLLAADIRKFTTSADAACALFMGTDKVRILDRRGFDRDVYSMIDEVVAYILSKINVEYIIKHVKREERPELPEEALREAVVNALAHRDYRSTANVQVYIFKDRVEIVSPGGLPAGMTEADLGLKSIPRNPLLFGLLHRMEAVEHIGSGIKRIRDLCREYGVAEPRIEVSENWFTVSFYRSIGRDENQASGENGRLGTISVPSWSQVGPKSVPSDLAVKMMQALTSPKDMLTLMALAGHTNRTRFRKTVLQPLIDANLVELTIPAKPRSSKQRYRLTERGRELLKQQGQEPS